MSNLGNFLTQAAQEMFVTEMRRILMHQIEKNADARFLFCQPIAVFYANVSPTHLEVARAVWGSTIEIEWLIYCKATKNLLFLMDGKGKVDWRNEDFDLNKIFERTVLLSKIEP